MELQGQGQIQQIQIEDYIEIILRRKWFIIIPFILSIIGIISTLTSIPPMYKSTTLILVEPQKVPESYVKPTITIDIGERVNTISQQVMSRTRLESIIKEFNLYPMEKKRLTPEEIVELMRNNIEIGIKEDARRKDLSSFTISYSGNNPETVRNVTSRLASLYIEENLKVREQQAEGTTEFLDGQLQGLKSGLETQEAQNKAFKEQFMGELPSQLETNLRTLDRLQLALQTTNDSLRGAEERKIIIEKQLTDIDPNAIVNTGAGGTVDPLRSRLATLQTELTQLSAIYTDKYPDIIRLKNEISDIEKELQVGKPKEKDHETKSKTQVVRGNTLYNILSNQLMDINSEIKNLKNKQKDITKDITIFQGRVERTPTRELQMSALIRDYENTRLNYQNLLNKKLDAQLSENLEKRQKGEQFKILDPANLPSKPFNSDVKKVVFIGSALGLGIGFGLVFLLEYIDGSFRKPEDVYATLGLPVLTSIPKLEIEGR